MMFNTGDIVRWTPDGSLEMFGRTDNQVKIKVWMLISSQYEALTCTGISSRAGRSCRCSRGPHIHCTSYVTIANLHRHFLVSREPLQSR